MPKKISRKIILSNFFYIILSIFAVIIIFPFFYMVSTSFQTIGELFAYPPILLPKRLYFDNYFKIFEVIPFSLGFFNSTFVALAQTGGHLFFDSLAGYALAKLRFPGKEKIFVAIIATMMIPPQALLIPLYVLMTKFNWVNTYQGLIIPNNIISAFGIFLMRQYMLSIPRDLIDAARIDGASEFRIYIQVALPVSKPIIAALSIITFNWSWQNFAWPLIITDSINMRTLPVMLTILQGEHVSDWNLILAGAVLSLLPIFIAFLLLRKWFIKSISLTGIKT